MMMGSVASMAASSPPVGPTPVASFTYLPTDPDGSRAVYFTDTSSGSPTAWEWKVNGVVFSTQQNPSYFFNLPGGYTVSLKASNFFGNNTHTETIQVERPGSGSTPVIP